MILHQVFGRLYRRNIHKLVSGLVKIIEHINLFQTKVKSHPNPRGSTRPRATWKYKHMLKRMTVPGESIPEEEYEDTDSTDTDWRY